MKKIQCPSENHNHESNLKTEHFRLFSLCAFSQNKEYFSKTYIDTMIQNAYFMFNKAASMEGDRNKYYQKQAIRHAESVVNKLKNNSKNDMNRQYILWKVSELEQQIWLEKQDLEFKEQKNLDITKNELINRFNNEVGRDRPNFAVLKNIYSQMSSIDYTKTSEMRWSLQQRSRNVSILLSSSMETSFNKNNFEKLQNEINYCICNHNYLSLRLQECNNWQNRIKTHLNNKNIIMDIKDNLKLVNKLTGENKFIRAHNTLQNIKIKASQSGGTLSKKEQAAIKQHTNALNERLEHKEDSIVNINLAILENNSVDEAIDYMNNNLIIFGIPSSKIAKVNQAIMDTKDGSSGNDAVSSDVKREIDDLTRTNGGISGLTMESVKQAVMKKTMDNIEEKLEKTIKLEKRAETDVRRAKNRYSRLIKRLPDNYEKQYEYKGIILTKNDAKQKIALIYSLLEKEQFEKAYKTFNLYKKEIEKHLSPNIFTSLQKNITLSKNIDSRDITDPIYVRSVKSSETPGKLSELDHKRKKAREIIVELYSLLEQNETRRAYKSFKESEGFLYRYALKEAFEVLYETIHNAYRN